MENKINEKITASKAWLRFATMNLLHGSLLNKRFFSTAISTSLNRSNGNGQVNSFRVGDWQEALKMLVSVSV